MGIELRSKRVLPDGEDDQPSKKPRKEKNTGKNAQDASIRDPKSFRAPKKQKRGGRTEKGLGKNGKTQKDKRRDDVKPLHPDDDAKSPPHNDDAERSSPPKRARKSPEAESVTTQWDLSPITDLKYTSLLQNARVITPEPSPIPSPLVGARDIGNAIRCLERYGSINSVRRLFARVRRAKRDRAIPNGFRRMQEDVAWMYWLGDAGTNDCNIKSLAGGELNSNQAIQVKFPENRLSDDQIPEYAKRIRAQLQGQPSLELYRLGSASVDADERWGFFLNVPGGAVVRVNDVDYENPSDGGILIIGPLDGFIVIEFFDQPIFLWRRYRDRRYFPAKFEPRKELLFQVPSLIISSQALQVKDLDQRRRSTSRRPSTPRSRPSKTAPTVAPVGTSAGRRSGEGQGAPEGPISPKRPKGTPRGSPKTAQARPTVNSAEVEATAQTPIIPKGSDPCLYFNQLLSELSKRSYVIRWESEVKRRIKNGEFPEFGAWLEDTHVMLAINSVVQAISRRSTTESGFRNISTKGSVRALRPESPVFLPWASNNHMVLIVIQMNEDRTIGIYVLDPKRWHHLLVDRIEIYKGVCEVIRRSKWYQLPSKKQPSFTDPPHAIWVEAAQQPEGWICAFYVIFQAWALAMGLMPNPGFVTQAGSEFLNHSWRLYILAIGGYLDYRIIFAFFRCYNFVLDSGTVPEDRRFQRTERQTSKDQNNDSIKKVISDEDAGLFDANNFQVNRSHNIAFDDGQRHDSDFIEDSWTQDIRNRMVPKLFKWGRLNYNQEGSAIQEDFYNAREEIEGIAKDHSRKPSKSTVSSLSTEADDYNRFPSTEEMRKRLPDDESVGRIKSRRQIKAMCMSKYTDLSPKNNLDLNEIEENACEWFEKSFPNPKKKFTDLINVSTAKTHEIDREGTEYLWNDDILLSIASVIEPIMEHQDNVHQNPVSGFSLTNSTALSMAIEFPDYPAERVARPRRPFFMPWVVSGAKKALIRKQAEEAAGKKFKPRREDELGHIMLIVIQEEDGHDRSTMHFLDSCPEYLEDSYGEIYLQARSVAQRMGWNYHRGTINLPNSVQIVDVAIQRNNWACGLHTIFNAWVCAMGLRVNANATFTNTFYETSRWVVNCALAGLINWKTIFAFFRCWNYIEGSINDVPQDRRFEFTRRQMGQDALYERIQEYVFNDTILETTPTHLAPLEFSNNVPFAAWSAADVSGDGDDTGDAE
ncbi:hypothetical protein K432DRAFT_440852 [Lepidopterella palustris CBS 459.81]|uniref:Ubiquitin-like protease family profile domain-containing protein n=1 Tax=Lepidopterella palustris CBS 459.81 TaxID=1314670 RepID=A0A8E2JI68_9PEZI|nr:hypothetical protein K432DRAFT_440852 [Lepidopterella palustris CBS 459.81]